jgi:hypothetical protein
MAAACTASHCPIKSGVETPTIQRNNSHNASGPPLGGPLRDALRP